MARRGLRAEADLLVEMGIVDALLEQGAIGPADRERAREALLGDVDSELCRIATEPPCYEAPFK